MNDFELVTTVTNMFEATKDKPKKKTGEQLAKEQGLTHFGLGRFGQGKNVSHVLHKGKLIAIQSPLKVTDKTDYKGQRHISVEVPTKHPLHSIRSEKQTKSLDTTLRDHNKTISKKMDNDHLDSIGHYISGKLDAALSTLKRGQNPRDPETQKKIHHFDNVLKKSKTPVSMSIFRPVNVDNLEKGKSYSFSSYLSGSIDPTEVEHQGKHLLHIEIPKGHPGLYNDRKKGKEYVLPRQSIIHVVSDPVAVGVPDLDKKGKVTKPQLLFKAIVKTH